MASTSSPSSPPLDSDHAVLGDEQSVLIADRLRRTRRYVKLIDLCTGLVTLLGIVLAYLLAVSLIDHWVIDLSPAMRVVLLLILLLGTAAFFVWRLLPPLLYSVNPVYAAQTIEQAAPSLKNSLINLVLLAGQRNGVSPVIYEGLRREAAGQLSRVPPETMVDRAPLIKAGYWLVALLAIAAIYKVLSPKDPVQSVARIAAPWMNIERPARVRIVDVDPGDVEVYRGQTVEVTARIEGLEADEAATVLYSTHDEQFIDQPIGMRREGPHEFRATLTMGRRGIQQSLVYRIAAGDAATGEFHLKVKNAPHVDVKRVTYQFPSYTQMSDRVVEGQAELSALEGTRVRIEAEANEPMATAYLELFDGSLTADTPDARPTQAVEMQTQGNRATGQLTLLLQPDRKTPQAAAYQIRFTTEDGQRNEQPARYRIEVTPDLPPDIEWLQPRSSDVELAENRSLALEVRAFDPDFAVAQVRVHGVVGGANRLRADLLDEPQSGQVIRKYQLVPRQLGLKAGDTLVYWAEARDNRRSPTGTPAPNSQRTANYRIRIVPPEPAAPSEGEQQSERAESGEQQSGEQQSGEQQSGEQQGGEQQGGEQQGGEQQGGEQQGGEQQGGEQQGGERRAGEQQERGEQEGGEQGADRGADRARAERARDGDAAGQRETGEATEPSEGATRGESEPEVVDESKPVAPDGSNDSEAFERILRHLKERQPDDAAQRRAQRKPQSPAADPAASETPPDVDPQQSDRAAEQPEPRSDDSGERSDKTTPPERSGEQATGDTRPESSGEQPDAQQSDAPNQGEGQSGDDPSDGQPSENDAAKARDESSDQGDATSASDPAEPTQPGAQDDRTQPSGSGQSKPGDSSSPQGSSSPPSGAGTPANGAPDGNSAQPSDLTSEASEQASRAPVGGQQNGESAEGSAQSDEADAAEAANLEYARRATDMALRHLKDEKHSAELRERLGWTKEEMDAFVRRWEQMQRAAGQSGRQGEQARRRLADQLRGLGLQPGAERVRASQARTDELRRLRQGGSEVPIPAEYLEQYRAFLKSAPPK